MAAKKQQTDFEEGVDPAAAMVEKRVVFSRGAVGACAAKKRVTAAKTAGCRVHLARKCGDPTGLDFRRRALAASIARPPLVFLVGAVVDESWIVLLMHASTSNQIRVALLGRPQSSSATPSPPAARKPPPMLKPIHRQSACMQPLHDDGAPVKYVPRDQSPPVPGSRSGSPSFRSALLSTAIPFDRCEEGLNLSPPPYTLLRPV